MHKNVQLLVIIGSSLLLGLRHGIDWDHIAAITDITGTSEEDRHKSLVLGTFYALGHATVIIILGLLAVLIGINLPDWVDSVMQPVVGITLILLGIWLISTIIIHGKNFRMRSRWMLVFAAIDKIYNSIHQKIQHKHNHPHITYPETYGVKTAYTVGLIHGIGAETPTQVLLFISAAGVGGGVIGTLLVFTFVLGLLLSNSGIILLSVTGFSRVHSHPYLRILLGLVTAVFSISVGSLFLLNKTNYLPALLGG